MSSLCIEIDIVGRLRSKYSKYLEHEILEELSQARYSQMYLFFATIAYGTLLCSNFEKSKTFEYGKGLLGSNCCILSGEVAPPFLHDARIH